MRMDDEDAVPAPPANMFAVRPDPKGPKTVAVLILLGAILLGYLAYGDYQFHTAEDLSDSDVAALLITPNSQASDADDLTVEQYQQFHDQARDSGGYGIRAVGFAITALLMIIGSILLFQLKPLGAWMNVIGACIGLISGVVGSWLVGGAAVDSLTGPLLLTYEVSTYLCGVCMATCLSLAALPLLNARARLALYSSPKVLLVSEQE